MSKNNKVNADTKNLGKYFHDKVRNIKNNRIGCRKLQRVLLRMLIYYPEDSLVVLFFIVRKGRYDSLSFRLDCQEDLMLFCQFITMLEEIAPLYDLVGRNDKQKYFFADGIASEKNEVVEFRYDLTCEIDLETKLIIRIMASRILKQLF